MKQQVGSGKCDCGTKFAAKVWCYIHGYLIKPQPVRRTK